VDIPTLFANGIEFVEEQHARCCARVIEYALHSPRRLAKETAYHRFVTNDKEWRS